MNYPLGTETQRRTKTAAGATSDPIGMAKVSLTSTDTTTNNSATDTQEITEATAAMLRALGAHQLVAFLVLGVDPPHHAARAPVDESGSQQSPMSSRAIGTPRSRIQTPILPCQKPVHRSPKANAIKLLFVISSIAPTDSGLEEPVDVSVQH